MMTAMNRLFSSLAFLLSAGFASAQAAPAPPRPEAPPTALLIIDIQSFYFPGGRVPLVEPEAASLKARQLLERFRAKGWPVVHVQHLPQGQAAPSPGTGDEQYRIHPNVMPAPGEPVIGKHHANSFRDTELLATLRGLGVKRLVIAGMQTHMCVEAAARHAADLGFEVVVAHDACATRALKFGGVEAPAAQVHAATLATLSGTYARVASVEELLGELAAAPVALGAGAPAVPPIDAGAVLEHTKTLASDAFEGRAPGTKGEEKSVAYITEQLRGIGLEPGNPDGSWVQKVPLVGTTVEGAPELTFRKGAETRRLLWRDDYVAWTKRVAARVALEASPMVFVGYGVQAPEFSWDDYKGVDLRGKTLVVLIGDPPVHDPGRPAELDPTVFGGPAMTYYGRWTYKYEMGAKLGAAGVLIVHETGPAGYPFAIVQGKTSEQFDLETPDGNRTRAAVEGWISLDQAKALFAMAGQDFEALRKRAVTREFAPVALGTTASVSLANTIRRVPSANVAGRITGSDPALRDEWVVYTTHWDHFGIGTPVNGDRIYRGAIDNASGVGGLIELARAMKPLASRRSILFLFVTAEEQGLLGSAYYAEHPLYPLAKTLAVLNLDALNVHGRTRDLTIVGLGMSSLDDVIERAAASQGRVVKPDPSPEKGSYYRSDHFPFARVGVPALHAGGGMEFLGRPADYGTRLRDEYIANDYHKPSDRVNPDWDLSGAVEDLALYLRTGLEIARGSAWPEWKPGAEFKPKRDEMLKAARP
jgi:Zn-dependent M28 family amino/carboxypeptidase/nicotinamidase-related amidase